MLCAIYVFLWSPCGCSAGTRRRQLSERRASKVRIFAFHTHISRAH